MDVINRINYEDYFLLYADNELLPAQRQEVEAFVLQHPDLAGEFHALQNTRLTPDSISFNWKGNLYKSTTEQPIVARENCEEYFILYYDNELSTAEKKAVEDFVAAQPETRENFELFGQLSLNMGEEQPFPEIAGLYRLPSGDSYTKMLSYLDGELSAGEAASFEADMLQHDALKKEFALFSQTKYSPDTSVRFPNIQSLYRKEKRKTPVIPLWLRMAAAASVLVFIAGIVFWQNDEKAPNVKAVAGMEKPAVINPINANKQNTNPASDSQNAAPVNENGIAIANESKNNETPVNNALNSRANYNGHVTSLPQQRNNNKQAIQVPGPELNAVQQPVLVREELQPEQKMPEELRKIIDKQLANANIASVTPEQGKTNIIPDKNAGNENGADADRVFEKENTSSSSLSIMNIPADQIAKRSGLKSVGRKITRFFERKVKNNGKPFSIGGVEVAFAH
jgi:hypothetical protein